MDHELIRSDEVEREHVKTLDEAGRRYLYELEFHITQNIRPKRQKRYLRKHLKSILKAL